MFIIFDPTYNIIYGYLPAEVNHLS